MKEKPLGICDFCGQPIAPNNWYTTQGKPRRFCSVKCKNTYLSRNFAAPVNKERMLKEIEEGTWQNPAKVNPPTSEEQARRARIGRLREIAEGRWRNPGLTPEARAINNRPRKHSGPLAEAIKIRRYGKINDLTEEQAEAYRAYQRELARQKRNQKGETNDHS